MTIVSRFAAYAAKLPFTVYDRMASDKHPVGVRLQKAQQKSLEHLWSRAARPIDDPAREGVLGWSWQGPERERQHLGFGNSVPALRLHRLARCPTRHSRSLSRPHGVQHPWATWCHEARGHGAQQ